MILCNTINTFSLYGVANKELQKVISSNLREEIEKIDAPPSNFQMIENKPIMILLLSEAKVVLSYHFANILQINRFLLKQIMMS